MTENTNKYAYSIEDIKKKYPQEVIDEELNLRREILDFEIEFKREDRISNTSYFKRMYKDPNILGELLNFLRKLKYVYERNDKLIRKVEETIIKLLSLKTTLVNTCIYASNGDKHTLLSYAMKFKMDNIVDKLLENPEVDINQKFYFNNGMLKEYYLGYNVNPIILYFDPLDNESLLNGRIQKILMHPNLELNECDIRNILDAIRIDILSEENKRECIFKRIEILGYLFYINNSKEIEDKIINTLHRMKELLDEIKEKEGNALVKRPF